MWVAGIEPLKLGGFERACVAAAREVRDRGVTLDFVFGCEPCPALAHALSNHAASWRVIPRVGTLGFQQTLALTAHLARCRPDVVHLHFCAFYVPFFVIARLLGVAIVGTYHVSGGPAPSTPLRRSLKRLRRALCGGALKRITAVSESARAKFIADYLEDPRRVTIVYNGIAPAFPEPRNVATHAAPRIAFVGALIREKGVDVAIHALATVRRTLAGATLTIVGDGPERDRLERLAAAMGVEHSVSFRGLRDDVPAILADHDIAVVPSTWHEAFGLVLLEAMSADCAVVASNIGGIPEIIRDGIDGVLVPPADVDALAAAIVQLWSSPAERAALVASARQRVASAFTLDRMIGRFWDIYRDAVSASAPSQPRLAE
jgi:glycosyltransferase involved in cell wall biosynthesis